MIKVSQLFLALATTTALGLPAAHAQQHQHAAQAKQGAGALEPKAGGCSHGKGCEHGGMGHGGGMKGHGMGMPGFSHMLVMHSETLKLTDEQIGKLHRLEMKHKKTQAGMAGVHESMQKLHQLLMDPAADEAAIKKAAAEHSTAFQAMVNDKVARRNEALAVLTADQKKALKTLKIDGKMMQKEDEGH